MIKSFLPLTLLFCYSANAKKIDLANVPWATKIKEAGIQNLTVCGSSSISVSDKSLNKDFIIGTRGYFFVNMLQHKDYLQTIKQMTVNETKDKLTKDFGQSQLWTYSKEKGVQNLGAPTKTEFPFKATVKDCVKGEKASSGMDCSIHEGTDRESCCFEKFRGPIIYWGNNSEYKLMYSPDPSVRIKVPGEKKHRYCNVQEIIEI